ncbi:MAG: MGMT family protein [Endomicrobiia bacterium]
MNKVDKELLKLLGRKNFLKIKDYSLFYKKVWLETLKIPKGEVRTYKFIARKVGNPKAYRAVAKVLKENPLTITIPCHRVIKSSGELGGYSKGSYKKYLLLKKEGVKNFT